jgi:RNA polymerase sigma-70 factor (ECF subfamily)
LALAVEFHEGQPPDEQARAFTALYREFAGPLLRYCRTLTGADGDPEALAHEALLRAWASWDPSSGRPFWPWVVTVARRLAIDQYRKAARRHVRRYAEVEASAGLRFPQPEDEAERKAEHALIRTALADLPETYRRVVRMHHVDGLSYDEIAVAEQTTVEAVRGTLRRARHALRAAYTRLEVGVPAILVLGARRARARIDEWLARLAGRVHPALPELAAAETFRGAVVLAVVLGVAGPLAPVGKPAPVPPVAAAPVQADAPGVTGADRWPTGVRADDATRPPQDAQAAEVPPVPAVPGWYPTLPDGVVAPEDAAFANLTPSPRPEDRTVFASGTSYGDCGRLACSILFRSSDGGATWQRLPAIGFPGGPVLLPPAWPRDPRIFVVGPRAVHVSTDSGATFRPITPRGQRAAMSPGFSSGDPHIWVGFLPGWDYDDRDGLVRPVNLSPLPTADYNTFAFAPAWPRDPRVFVGSWVPSVENLQQGVVSLCRDGRCGPPVRLPGAIGSPEIAVAGDFADTGTAFAWAGSHLFRTDDAGASFQRLTLPDDGLVTSLVTSGDRLHLSLLDVTDGQLGGGVFVSDDRGETWRRLGGGSRLDGGVQSVARFGGTRLLAAPQALAGGGLLCSVDDGTTWADRCSI